jgi:tetratricopeptide (TPR) repeat protein
MRHLIHSLLIITLVYFSSTHAEEGVLIVHIANPLQQPISGVVLSTTGASSTSAPTDVAGKTRIQLAPQTRPGVEVTLQIVRAPQDLVFISPWNQRITIRSFEDESQNVSEVVLVVRGSRALLEYPQAQLAMAQKVNDANAVKVSGEQPTEEQLQVNLAGVAKSYGLKPEEVDRAIRSLNKKTTDPYELGQIALYESHYGEAARQLGASVEERKRRLESEKGELADAQFFLGRALYEQGKYGEAAAAFREAAVLRPDDTRILNNLGAALNESGQYAKAEECYQQALKISEKVPESESPDIGTSLNNLAALYTEQGRYAKAEPLYKQALAIDRKLLGSEHSYVATDLNNLGLLYYEQNKYAEAEPLYKQALAIDEKLPASEQSKVATDLNNMGLLYTDQGRYAEAVSLLQRALKIDQEIFGTEHPNSATDLNNLARLYTAQGKYAEAEPLFKRALVIKEANLGNNHPSVATTCNNLAKLYTLQGKYAEAEPLYKRALAIREDKFGPEHQSVANTLESYVVLLRKMNRAEEAERMEASAKKIRAKQK